MLTIYILQQSAWDIPMDSVPLAAGYLKAAVEAHPDLAQEISVRIRNFRGGMSLPEMARSLFADGTPDVLAVSVVGWNYRNFVCLADTFKQIRPDGLVVFGGNHVSYQAERVFRESAAVDIVVNGEGEHTFRQLVEVILAEDGDPDFSGIRGLSYRGPDRVVQTNADRGRIENLDEIPSPFLSGTIPLVGRGGEFPYEFALMETNRGCPYKCAFCYWGGAVGQRVRTFSRERLAAELDVLAYHRVNTVFLCDANFGMLESDEAQELVHARPADPDGRGA